MGLCTSKKCIKCKCPMSYYYYSEKRSNEHTCQIHRPGVIKGIQQCSDCGKGNYDRGNCRHIWKRGFI